MTAIDEVTNADTGVVGLVHRLANRFRPISRRSLLVGTAVAASALATNPRYALTPGTAYGAVCGPGNTSGSGWSVFCCTINNGVNACPPGSFTAGWWKAADSSWCGSGYRYLIDCNARCTKCTSGCSDNICDRGCWNCSCGHGSSSTCDQRLICCNAFRYGQCNTDIRCSGGVHCRMVSCVPPYRWANCGTTSFSDNRTAEHSAPCIPRWGAIEKKYDSLGGPASFLRMSTGPIHVTGDGKGQYVSYQGGTIYWSSASGAHAMPTFVRDKYVQAGGVRGYLGYPTSDRVSGLRNGGWIQLFQHGAITDSPQTTTQIVYGIRYDRWRANGREGGVLGYPTGGRVALPDDAWIQLFQNGAIVDSANTHTQVVWGTRYDVWKANGREKGVLGFPTGGRVALPDGAWIQLFQGGAIVDSTDTHTQVVWGKRYDVWKANGREKGVLGFPTGGRVALPDGAWIQLFQNGAIVDSTSTYTRVVSGVFWTAWKSAGREKGVLGYPSTERTSVDRGSFQKFVKGELWALGSGAARRVYGGVLTKWKAAGGAGGSYGFPITDTKFDGTKLTCTFEHGTITA